MISSDNQFFSGQQLQSSDDNDEAGDELTKYRQSRIFVMNMLYSLEKDSDLPRDYLALSKKIPGDICRGGRRKKFARQLYDGVMKNRESIRITLECYLKNWSLDRLSIVDRILLEIGIYEIKHLEKVPFRVTINEILEIAREFGLEKSTAFQNGILDAVAKEMLNP